MGGTRRQASGDERARRDHLLAGHAELFADPLAHHVATNVGDVADVLATVQAAASDGRWMVGWVAYEAAAAFDPAFVTQRLITGPLAHFVEFGSTTATDPIPRPRDQLQIDVERLGGSRWYRAGVDTIRAGIERGDYYQVNLTDRFVGGTSSTVDTVYAHLCHRQRADGMILIDLGDTAVACASPELFFRMDGDTITVRPMKGTTSRRARRVDDEAAARWLSASEKDRAENVMIVDLLRNDLSRLSVPFGVAAGPLFEVERYETVWQMVSTVTAQRRPATSLVDIFAALFPCGSITGAPKAAAMTCIATLEPAPRGPYCGAIGVVGPGPAGGWEANFQVGIRTAVITRPTPTAVPASIVYGSGGGITWDSEPFGEDDELHSKAKVLEPLPPPFSLIETLCIDTAGPRHWPLHLDRLRTSAAYFGFPLDESALGAVAALTADQPSRLRLVAHFDSTLEVAVGEVDAQPSTVVVAVAPSTVSSNDPFCAHKTTNRRVYDEALRSARELADDIDDVLLVNERGEIVESTIANVLYCIDGTWFTPPSTSGGLDGVGRRLLVDSGQVFERVVLATELGNCSAIDLVSSLRGRRRVVLRELAR